MIRAFGARIENGGVLTHNEDAYLAVPERQLYAVADGFGGVGVGDFTARKILDDVRDFVEYGLGDSEVTLPFVYRGYMPPSSNLIFNAVLNANDKLVVENKKKHINARGGASVLAAFLEGSNLTLANAGSCAAYLFRRGRVQQIVRPRSYNAVKGVFQGSWNVRWAFPTAAVGLSKDLEPEIIELQLQKGDQLLLATDGIYPRLSEDDFLECFSMLSGKTALDLAIQQQNQRLIEIAQAKGNTDNQAMISLVYG